MKLLLVAAALVLAGEVFAQDAPPAISRTRTMAEADDPLAFQEYRDRLTDRWEIAIENRRYMNRGRVHVYRTAVVIPVDPIGTSAIQRGWVWQPPIYRGRSWLDAMFELEMARMGHSRP